MAMNTVYHPVKVKLNGKLGYNAFEEQYSNSFARNKIKGAIFRFRSEINEQLKVSTKYTKY